MISNIHITQKAASENPEDLHAFPGICFILQLKIHFLSSFEFIGCTQAYLNLTILCLQIKYLFNQTSVSGIEKWHFYQGLKILKKFFIFCTIILSKEISSFGGFMMSFSQATENYSDMLYS